MKLFFKIFVLSAAVLCNSALNAMNKYSESTETSPKLSLEIGSCSLTGTKHTANEDRFAIINSDNYDFFGVFDGHGHRTDKKPASDIAEYLALNLPEMIRQQIFNPDNTKNTHDIIIAALKNIDDEAIDFPRVQGSTAVFGVLIDNDLWIANLGDSRAGIFQEGKPFFATTDHKASNAEEQE